MKVSRGRWAPDGGDTAPRGGNVWMLGYGIVTRVLRSHFAPLCRAAVDHRQRSDGRWTLIAVTPTRQAHTCRGNHRDDSRSAYACAQGAGHCGVLPMVRKIRRWGRGRGGVARLRKSGFRAAADWRCAMARGFEAYRLPEQHEVLRETVRARCEGKVAPNAAEADEAGQFPQASYDVLRASELHAPHIPSEYGGVGADALATAIVSE